MSLFNPNRKSLGLGFIGVASMMLVASLGGTIYFFSFTRSAAHARGQIVQLISRQDKDSGTIYYPVFTFRDADGAEHTVTSSVGSAPPSCRVGDKIQVLYQSDAPNDAKIDSFFSLWGFPLAFGVLGLFGVAIGVAILRWPRREFAV